jgi:hypothetical protein
MSTQRRDGRWAPTTEIGRRSLRHGSRLAQSKALANRANRLELAEAVWSFPAANASGRMVSPVAHLPAIAFRQTLQEDTHCDTRCDTRNGQHVRSNCPGSPPAGRAAGLKPLGLIGYRLFGYLAIPFPAVFARLHPTLPDVPVAFCSRTERYDGKGNLYFKHAA